VLSLILLAQTSLPLSHNFLTSTAATDIFGDRKSQVFLQWLWTRIKKGEGEE